LSINNYSAAEAALAKYPAITLPMAYQESGEPINLTMIAKPFEEMKLLQLAHALEKARPVRKSPTYYQ
jgi:amidase